MFPLTLNEHLLPDLFLTDKVGDARDDVQAAGSASLATDDAAGGFLEPEEDVFLYYQ